MEQNWTITSTVVADWVEVVVENVDGREKGMLASRRAGELARANGWTMVQKSLQWIGQNRNFDTYEGSPTGLVMTIIRRDGEPPAMEGVDSPYMAYGKRVSRKMRVFLLVRDGSHNFYLDKEGFKVSLRISEHGPYAPPQWTPYKGSTYARTAKTGGTRGADRTGGYQHATSARVCIWIENAHGGWRAGRIWRKERRKLRG